MSFIDQFLDLTAPVPRQIIRWLKLIKETDERSKEMKAVLDKKREIYLEKLKENKNNNNSPEGEQLYNEIEKLYKDLLILSDYKKEILSEIKYILEHTFKTELGPIITEAEKECEIERMTNLNQYSAQSLGGNLEKGQEGFFESPEGTRKKKEEVGERPNSTKNFLKVKTNRLKHIKVKKVNGGISSGEYSEERTKAQVGEDPAKEEHYCLCGGGSFGKMIECENPFCKIGWFHYDCIKVPDGAENKSWFCSPECEMEKKRMKDSGNNIKNPKKRKMHG